MLFRIMPCTEGDVMFFGVFFGGVLRPLHTGSETNEQQLMFSEGMLGSRPFSPSLLMLLFLWEKKVALVLHNYCCLDPKK